MSYPLIHKAIDAADLSAKVRAEIDAIVARGAYILQPKYDGVNGVLDVTQDGRGWAFAELRTRTGEKVPSCNHIELAALELLPGRYFGEIWAPGRKHTEINGAARQHKPAEWLEFRVFDYILPEHVTAGGIGLIFPYTYRLEDLEIRNKLGSKCGLGPIYLADTVEFQQGAATLDDIIADVPSMLDNLRDDGNAYDGFILRPLDKGLKLGSSGSDGAIIKLKPRASADLLCVGTFPGKGKYTGMDGGIVVSLDGTAGGPTCEVGTGFFDAQRADLSYNIGKIVELEYLELTAKGKLREPSYKGIRTDKLQPDNLIG